MGSRITSVCVARSGDPVKHRSVDRASSAFAAAYRRWKHLLPEGKSTKWAHQPAQVSADLARAAAKDLVTEYGELAWVKAVQLWAASALRPGSARVSLAGSWPAANARVALEVALVPHENYELGVEMDVVASADLTEQQAMDSAMEPSPPASARIPLDPLGDLMPSEHVAALVKEAEAGFDREQDGIDALTAAAATLLVWQRMEAMGADTTALTLTGVNRAGAPLFPGQDVRLSATAVLMDAPPAPPAQDEQTVRAVFRPKRPS